MRCRLVKSKPGGGLILQPQAEVGGDPREENSDDRGCGRCIIKSQFLVFFDK